MEPKEKKAFEPSGLVPRSIVRTFERFRQQLLPGSETAAIREYRISRYQVLVSARCLFTLLIIPIATNWLVSSWLLSPLVEHFWNTQQNEIFLNSYQEERAFAELESFSEKLFFESLLNTANTSNVDFTPTLRYLDVELRTKHLASQSKEESKALTSASLPQPAKQGKPFALQPRRGKGEGMLPLLISYAPSQRLVQSNPKEQRRSNLCFFIPATHALQGNTLHVSQDLQCKASTNIFDVTPLLSSPIAKSEGLALRSWQLDSDALLRVRGLQSRGLAKQQLSNTVHLGGELERMKCMYAQDKEGVTSPKEYTPHTFYPYSFPCNFRRGSAREIFWYPTDKEADVRAALSSESINHVDNPLRYTLHSFDGKNPYLFQSATCSVAAASGSETSVALHKEQSIEVAKRLGNPPFPCEARRDIVSSLNLAGPYPKGLRSWESDARHNVRSSEDLLRTTQYPLAKLNFGSVASCSDATLPFSYASPLPLRGCEAKGLPCFQRTSGKGLASKGQLAQQDVTPQETAGVKAPSLLSPSDNSLKIKEKVQNKILELAIYYNQQTIISITNIVGDVVSLVTLGCLFIWMKPEITILKSFLIEAIYSLSDTTKSFLLILLTDLLVGFHSPRGWETALELLLKHFGLPENQDFVFLFVATFPVLLDTVFKYWIFRHLNKISPSTVATYHSMIE